MRTLFRAVKEILQTEQSCGQCPVWYLVKGGSMPSMRSTQS